MIVYYSHPTRKWDRVHGPVIPCSCILSRNNWWTLEGLIQRYGDDGYQFYFGVFDD